jgi:hypothetical protein
MDAVNTGITTLTILQAISQGPVVFVALVMVLGPWITMFLLFWVSNRNHERRFREVEVMYKKNVRLVQDYSGVCESLIRVAEEQTGYMVSNTAALTLLTDRISTNQFCPMARVRTKTEDEG